MSSPYKTETTSTAKSKDYRGLVGYVLLICILTSTGILMHSTTLIEAIIAVYTVIAIVFKVKSSITFTMGVIAIPFIPISSWLHPSNNVSAVFATFTFLLLTSGSICFIVEQARERRLRSHPAARGSTAS